MIISSPLQIPSPTGPFPSIRMTTRSKSPNRNRKIVSIDTNPLLKSNIPAPKTTWNRSENPTICNIRMQVNARIRRIAWAKVRATMKKTFQSRMWRTMRRQKKNAVIAASVTMEEYWARRFSWERDSVCSGINTPPDQHIVSVEQDTTTKEKNAVPPKPTYQLQECIRVLEIQPCWVALPGHIPLFDFHVRDGEPPVIIRMHQEVRAESVYQVGNKKSDQDNSENNRDRFQQMKTIPRVVVQNKLQRVG